MNGKEETIDLSKAGDVFGQPSGSGNTRTVSMSSSGFTGNYGLSPTLEEAEIASNP